jgi:hypothetical protein
VEPGEVDSLENRQEGDLWQIGKQKEEYEDHDGKNETGQESRPDDRPQKWVAEQIVNSLEHRKKDERAEASSRMSVRWQTLKGYSQDDEALMNSLLRLDNSATRSSLGNVALIAVGCQEREKLSAGRCGCPKLGKTY